MKDCTKCKYFVPITSGCTYRKNGFRCVRDDESFKAEKAKAENEQPTLF